MIGAVVGETYPAAGVIVASPATAPVRRPTKVGRLSSNHPTTSQVTAANEAATSVLRNASAVTESTGNSLPPLKPYQPNQSKPVPRATSGTLCGPSTTWRRPT